MVPMNRLSREKRVRIVAALCEGNSVRSTCRMTGASKGAVLKLLAEIGTACREYQDEHLRGLTCKRIQCDERKRTSRRKCAARLALATFGRGPRSTRIPSSSLGGWWAS